jgi:hypothetical protein
MITRQLPPIDAGGDRTPSPTRTYRISDIPPGALLRRRTWMREHAVHPRRLASEEFIRVFRGWLTPVSAPAALNEMCSVVQESLLPGSVICGPTAAVLYGAPLPVGYEKGIGLLVGGSTCEDGALIVPSTLGTGTDVDDPSRVPSHVPIPDVHVLVGPGVRLRTGSPRLLAHRVRSAPSGIDWHGLTLLHPLPLLLELAEDLPLWDLVAIVDWFVGEDSPGTLSPRKIRAFAAEAVGDGANRLRTAAGLCRELVASPMETYARLLVTFVGFTEPTPNLRIDIPGDSRRYRKIDNAWEDCLVGLEYNGDYHRLSKDQWRKDQRRRDDLRSVGWELRDQTMADIRHPVESLLALRDTIAARGGAVPSTRTIRERCARLRAEPPSLILAPGSDRAVRDRAGDAGSG